VKSYQLNFKQYGDKSILIEWPALIDNEILNNRVGFEKLIRSKAVYEFKNIIQDIIPAYNSITLVFQEKLIDFKNKISYLNELYLGMPEHELFTQQLFHIPVCYANAFSIDLDMLASSKGMTVNEVIHLHTKPIYTVHFIGFLPGFLYLGGLHQKLHCQRKVAPSLFIPKGSVAIGGEQTGVYPQQSPGGWHVIGSTPIEIFSVSAESPCFLYANDKIKFFSVDLQKYESIQKEIEEGSYQIKHELINA